jgi:hypothetical protein
MTPGGHELATGYRRYSILSNVNPCILSVIPPEQERPPFLEPYRHAAKKKAIHSGTPVSAHYDEVNAVFP